MKQAKSGLISLVLAVLALVSLGYGLAVVAPQWKENDEERQRLEHIREMESGWSGAPGPSSVAPELERSSHEGSELLRHLEDLTAGSIAAVFFSIVLGFIGLRRSPRGLAIAGLVGSAAAIASIIALLDAVPSMF
ncbi:MAG: hypothetical protein H6712_24510 [Myxococcales bacterium]|nr:hypothetical protein [Myxococcales bacterium]MCB9717042.1 hypothetical protein [Myxococcales bacterium]